MKFLLLILVVTSAHNLTEFDLKNYLQNFGYLSITSNESLQVATRQLQRVGGIQMTGELDEKTADLLTRKRCGLGDKELVQQLNNQRTNPPFRWNKKEISYSVKNTARTIEDVGYVRRALFDAASIWNAASSIRIFETNEQQADINVSFEEDTQKLTLAKTIYPIANDSSVEIHFNDAQTWGFHSGEIDLKVAALHQLGHAVGLHHSDHPKSIMYPFYSNVQLHHNDVLAIQRLYGTSTEKPKIQSATRKPPSNLPIDPCNSAIDAIEQIGDEIFLFRHDKYWRISSLNGSLISRPRSLEDYWPELLQWPVKAVVEVDNETLFFVEDKVLTFINRRLQKTQNLTEYGLPFDVDVRLAYRWTYNGGIYVWNLTHYWKLDFRTMSPEIDYPRRIANIWKGIPESVSAAFSWGSEMFFVDAGELYRFDSFKMAVARGYPRRFSGVFDYCLPRVEA